MVASYLDIAEKKPTAAFVFNAGTGIQSSIKDVVDTVQRLVPQKLVVEWGKSVPRPWEPKAWRASTTQSKQHLDWAPKYSLKEGIKKSLSWFAKNIHLYHQEEKYETKVASTQARNNTCVS
jgi:nucleoside-diphosphate-sugar epimerase